MRIFRRRAAFLWLTWRKIMHAESSQERENRMEIFALVGVVLGIFLLGVGTGGNGWWAVLGVLVLLFVAARIRSFYVLDAARRLGLEQGDAYQAMAEAERHLDDAIDRVAQECHRKNLRPPWWADLAGR